jgi:hypothetical protein
MSRVRQTPSRQGGVSLKNFEILEGAKLIGFDRQFFVNLTICGGVQFLNIPGGVHPYLTPSDEPW